MVTRPQLAGTEAGQGEREAGTGARRGRRPGHLDQEPLLSPGGSQGGNQGPGGLCGKLIGVKGPYSFITCDPEELVLFSYHHPSLMGKLRRACPKPGSMN